MNRRDFLRAIPLGLTAAAAPLHARGLSGRAFGASPLLRALTNSAQATDRVLVLINLGGGNDGLNTLIPFEDPLYIQNRARTGFVAPRDRTTLNATLLRPGLALNPQMNAGPAGSTFLDLWRGGRMAIVQNVGYPDPSYSHFRSTDIWNSASDSNIVLSTGWIGRYLDTEFPQYPLDVKPGDDPLAIQIDYSLSPVFQGSQAEMGLAVADPTHYDPGYLYADDPSPDTAHGAELAFVRSLLLQSNVYGNRFQQLFASPPQSRVEYPQDNDLALQLQKVAWCITSGMKTRIYFVSQDGYDTHSQQNSRTRGNGQGELLFRLAEAIATFQADIDRMGIADRVVGMTYSEFGRRVDDNDSLGTDHGTAAPSFIFGNAINGQLYGPNPDLVDLNDNGDLKWKVDFRQLYAAVLGDWFGVSTELRKAILNQPANAQPFGVDFDVNGCPKMQPLFRQPLRAGLGDGHVTQAFFLRGNSPNPFRGETLIRFDLARSEHVTLEVFDSRGAPVRTLMKECLSAGPHQATFRGDGLASGVYFYRLEGETGVQTRKMLYVK